MLNRCEFIGHLGAAPDVKYTQAGDAIANFSVAATEKWRDKDGNQQERTEWVRVVTFKKLAEICGEYLDKGSLVYVSGRMQTDKFTGSDGVEKYSTKIVVDTMKMLSKRDDGGNEQQSQRGGSSGSRGGAPQRKRQPAQQQAPLDDFADDDIPFIAGNSVF